MARSNLPECHSFGPGKGCANSDNTGKKRPVRFSALAIARHVGSFETAGEFLSIRIGPTIALISTAETHGLQTSLGRRKMNVTTLGFAILFCLSGIATPICSTNSQDSERHALKNYEGVWDCKFTIQPQSEGDDPKSFTGVVEGKWVVGEKFLEQTGSYRLDESSEPLVIKTMMSFDVENKRYRYDYFMSSGEVQRSFGKWDADAKTMTSTMTDDGKVTSIVADFSRENVESWTIETRNEDGKTITKVVGTNTRRTKK